jgi:NitT/TauT family transport system substrate-binding protein
VNRAHLIAGAAALAAGTALPANAQTKKLKPVTLVLDWVGTQPQYLGFWLAKANGWYADEGLDVTINTSSGADQAIEILSGGRADFANLESSSFVQVSGKRALPIQMIGMFAQRDSLSIAYFESSGIKKPKDLEGRKLGIVPGSMPHLLWPSFALATGVDASKVELFNWDYRSFYGIFAAKKVDACGNFTIGSTGEYQFKQHGETVNQFVFADYLPLLGSGIVARNDTIKSDPETVRGFARATQRAWAYLTQKSQAAVPEAAAALHSQVEETPEPAIIAQYAFELIPARIGALRGKTVGTMNAASWTKMIDLLAKSDKTMTRRVVPVDLMTNDFLSPRFQIT